MGIFSSKKIELHDEILDEHAERLFKKCDEFNQNFKRGDFIRYWYDNNRDWDSTFAFVTVEAGYLPNPVNQNWISKCWFRAIPIPLYGKRENYSDSLVDITERFHFERATEEDFIEYKHNSIEKSIKNDKENMKLLRSHIRTQIKERSDLVSNMEFNINTIKRLISNGGTNEQQ